MDKMILYFFTNSVDVNVLFKLNSCADLRQKRHLSQPRWCHRGPGTDNLALGLSAAGYGEAEVV